MKTLKKKPKNKQQYTFGTNPPINEPTPEPMKPVILNHLGQHIEANLCGLYMTIKRPGARPMMKEMKVEATTVDQDQAQVSEEQITRPCWKIDIHPLWDEIDKNKAAIDKVLAKYSVSASVKGEHLVSMLKIGELLRELNVLRKQRLTMADHMAAKWETEIIPGMAAKFPQFFENQIKDRLPDPGTLRDRFDVLWLIRPLTPMSNDNLNLSALKEDEAREVIAQNQEFIHKLAQQRFQQIFDEVFGEVMTLCEEIANGEYAFGKRKAGALEDILNLLERITNFGAFANEDVLRHVEIASTTLRKYNIKEVNASETVQSAIKNAMAPLGAALKQLTQQNIGGRADRNVSL